MSEVKGIISKELLSHVFTDDQQDFEAIGICPENERLFKYIWIEELPDYYTGEGIRKVHMTINIYELAHRCKQWAYKLDEYIIDSNIFGADVYDRYACHETPPVFTSSESEVEAVFEVCEWILKNNKKGNK